MKLSRFRFFRRLAEAEAGVVAIADQVVDLEKRHRALLQEASIQIKDQGATLDAIQRQAVPCIWCGLLVSITHAKLFVPRGVEPDGHGEYRVIPACRFCAVVVKRHYKAREWQAPQNGQPQ